MLGTRREVLSGGAAVACLSTLPLPAFAENGSLMSVTVNRLSIHVSRYSAAPAGAVPVVYVHGATFPASLAVGWKSPGDRSWADDLVDAGYDIWGFDFAGYGRSDRYPAMAAPPVPGPLGRSDAAAAQLAAVVRHVRAQTGQARVVLLAHSWGTIVAGRFAAEHPAAVERLVLFGPILPRDGGSLEGIDRLPGWTAVTADDQITRFREDVPPGEPQLITDAMFAPWASAYLASDAGSSSRTPPAVAVPNGPSADIAAARAGILPYDPAALSCPVAIVRGAWDSRVTDADVAKFRARLVHCPSFSDAKLERGTHLMHLETGRERLWIAARNGLAEAKRAPVDTHAVIFEVEPTDQGRPGYLATAAALRPLLDEVDGFISIERFQSKQRPERILSLSLWADEEAIAAWRSRDRHHAAQQKGRGGIFRDYRLRVAHALLDGGVPPDRQPPHPAAYNDPSRRQIAYLGLAEVTGDPPPPVARLLGAHSRATRMEAFASLTNGDKNAYLLEFASADRARAWHAAMQAATGPSSIASRFRVRLLEVLRDYGMFDRGQAPQYHPPAVPERA